MTSKLDSYLTPVPAYAADPLAGWWYPGSESLCSALTMCTRKLLVFCLLLPWSHPLGNVNKQERAKGSPCISKSVCARESEEKGKVQESAQWIGLGLKKKKKKKSSVREMRQRRLWSSLFNRDWRLLFEVSTVRQRSAADGNLLKSVFPTAGSSSARGHLSTQTRQCVAIARSLKQCSLSDYSLLTPFNK